MNAHALILIDAGNTRIKWALTTTAHALGAPWLAAGDCLHADIAQLGGAWQQALQAATLTAALTAAEPPHLWAANVAGEAIATALQSLAQQLGASIHWATAQNLHPSLRNDYRNPAQLGSDRWLGALGARQLFGARPLLVVSCGTATTLDALPVLDAQRSAFSGGVILPGLSLMLRSLARDTAQLPQVDSALQDAPEFANHTQAALAHGCLMAQLGAIELAWREFAKVQHTTPEQALCVITGGAQEALAPHLTMPLVRYPNLVLVGLHTLAKQAD